ncbi:histidinol-phosphate transaminase [Anaeromicropila herbilytica]|uniref:Histidinol-phosphate aminotransferase n=1 Tax=Anaeromicropila herbilytica TaxID=2785025 RepID=A0A7R7EMM6_9FIRM|nr:histidinol-phosphate transaminase [Anaeromicropila herbilytica]BCN31370.1 histidinol-phosphate aminotransferase [Anaeromicropila herbilytica]
MSKFLLEKYKNMVAYIPGEQPKDRAYIKLNANETSMKPSPKVLEVLKSSRMNGLGHYADPDAKELRTAIAELNDVAMNQVFVGNGSDEVLGFLFLAYFNEQSKICYPDITYGFYQVFAKTFGINGKQIPLKEDFTVDVDAYVKTNRHVILANPNAPTGYYLPVSEIERIVVSNPNRLVVIDEAYIDYGNESCIPLTKKYDNLIVVHTMSKSKNLAGAHIGYCIASEKLIEDLNGIKYSFNPYSMNDITIAIGTAAIKDTAYYKKCIQEIINNREYTKCELERYGFTVLDSATNFIFVTHPNLHAREYNAKLREHGILARYFDSERIQNYLRITIGTRQEMEQVIMVTSLILEELVA